MEGLYFTSCSVLKFGSGEVAASFFRVIGGGTYPSLLTTLLFCALSLFPLKKASSSHSEVDLPKGVVGLVKYGPPLCAVRFILAVGCKSPPVNGALV